MRGAQGGRVNGKVGVAHKKGVGNRVAGAAVDDYPSPLFI